MKKDSTVLNQESFNTFQNNFGTLHDALICSITLNFIRGRKEPVSIKIVLDAIVHPKRNKKREWTKLVLEIDNVSEYNFAKKSNYDAMIVFEVAIGFFNNQIHLNFTPDRSKIEKLEDIIIDESHPTTVNSYIVGETCYWYIEPIEE